jgi:DNA replication and repair protein RecF
MYLKTLYLKNFRNYIDQTIDFSAAKTILLGNNAQGKSNILEAVELLATLKSHRAFKDKDLVNDQADTAKVTAFLAKDNGESELSLMFRKQGRRTAIVNQEKVHRQLDFLGILNAVEFSSLDLDLVRGSPENRRLWLDSLLIQLEPIYAHILHQYNHILKQRNALLKQIKKQTEKTQDHSVQLALWDAQLATTGSRVTRRRDRVLKLLTPIAQTWHSSISGNSENLEIKYLPNVTLEKDDPDGVQQTFLDKISEKTLVEQIHGTTLVGPHRDEIEFTINNTPARVYGSQGQQRTLVLSLKLAELKLIESVIGEPPLLLLDDVLAELDPKRQNQLLDAIQDKFQTLITTTHLGSFDAQWLKSSQILSVQAGQIYPDVLF